MTGFRTGWLVRAIALLLVAVGVQAGSFRDLDGAHDWYFGSPDSRTAALLELRRAVALPAVRAAARDADALPDADPASTAAAPPGPRPLQRAVRARFALLDATRVSLPGHLLPDPTGPPRA